MRLLTVPLLVMVVIGCDSKYEDKFVSSNGDALQGSDYVTLPEEDFNLTEKLASYFGKLNPAASLDVQLKKGFRGKVLCKDNTYFHHSRYIPGLICPDGSSNDPFTVNSKLTECDLVTFCGQSATTTSTTSNGDSVLSFNNLPHGCEGSLDIYSVSEIGKEPSILSKIPVPATAGGCIDTYPPKILGVKVSDGDPGEACDNTSIIVSVDAKDEEGPLHQRAYSFDGGQSWGTEKSIRLNKPSIEFASDTIQVRDLSGNVTVHKPPLKFATNCPCVVTLSQAESVKLDHGEVYPKAESTTSPANSQKPVYTNLVSSCSQSCDSLKLVLRCENGALVDNKTNLPTKYFGSCTPGICAECLTADKKVLVHGWMGSLHSVSAPEGNATCSQLTNRSAKCSDGKLVAIDGSDLGIYNRICIDPTFCETKDGVKVKTGMEGIGFATNSVECGQSCSQRTGICVKGSDGLAVLKTSDGSILSSSCQPKTCNPCQVANSESIMHNSSSEIYSVAQNICPQTRDQVKLGLATCKDGILKYASPAAKLNQEVEKGIDGRYSAFRAFKENMCFCNEIPRAPSQSGGSSFSLANAETGLFFESPPSCPGLNQSIGGGTYELRTCNNGTLSGTSSRTTGIKRSDLSSTVVTAPELANIYRDDHLCMGCLLNGQSYTNNSILSAKQINSVGLCESLQLKCWNGQFFNLANNQTINPASLSKGTCSQCQAPSGFGSQSFQSENPTIPIAKSFYNSAASECDSCEKRFLASRVCSDGKWLQKTGDMYVEATLPVAQTPSGVIGCSISTNCQACTAPWGTKIQNNSSLMAFRSATAGCKETCEGLVGGAENSIVAKCVNGVFDRDLSNFKNSSCEIKCDANSEGGGAPRWVCNGPFNNIYTTGDRFLYESDGTPFKATEEVYMAAYKKSEVKLPETCEKYRSTVRCNGRLGLFEGGLGYVFPSCREVP